MRLLGKSFLSIWQLRLDGAVRASAVIDLGNVWVKAKPPHLFSRTGFAMSNLQIPGGPIVLSSQAYAFALLTSAAQW